MTEEKHTLKDLFDLVDGNGDDHIDSEEFELVLRTIFPVGHNGFSVEDMMSNLSKSTNLSSFEFTMSIAKPEQINEAYKKISE